MLRRLTVICLILLSACARESPRDELPEPRAIACPASSTNMSAIGHPVELAGLSRNKSDLGEEELKTRIPKVPGRELAGAATYGMLGDSYELGVVDIVFDSRESACSEEAFDALGKTMDPEGGRDTGEEQSTEGDVLYSCGYNDNDYDYCIYVVGNLAGVVFFAEPVNTTDTIDVAKERVKSS